MGKQQKKQKNHAGENEVHEQTDGKKGCEATAKKSNVFYNIHFKGFRLCSFDRLITFYGVVVCECVI